MDLKIRPLEQLVNTAQTYKMNGKKIVTTNGCFDVLHIGHVRALQESKKQGHILIVGIDSDEAIRRRNKGPGRPINTENDRAELVAGLSCVDYVTIYNFDDCRPFIEAIKPNVHTNGPEYGRPEDWVEYDVLKRLGVLPYVYTRHQDLKNEDYSTTSLIKKILALYKGK